jgi:lipopolysaccharide export system permease protein
MRILTRYLFRLHIGPFIFALSVLTGLLFVNAVAKRYEDLAGKGLPLDVVLEFMMLSLPHIIALTLPMAVLVSVLFAFSQLTAENEIAAMKAGGINMVRVVAPLIVVATMLTGGMIWFNDRVLPETNYRLKTLLIDVGRKNPTLTFRAGEINQVQSMNWRTRYFLQPAQIDHTTNRMRDVVIYDLSNARRARTVYADSGQLIFNQGQTALLMALYDGHITEVSETKPEEFQRIYFDRQYIEMKDIGMEFTRGELDTTRGDREMSVSMLRAEADSAKVELEQVRQESEEMTELAVRRALEGPGPSDFDLPASSGATSGMRRGGRSPRMFVDSPIFDGSDDLAQTVAAELRMLQSRTRMAEVRYNSLMVEYHKKFAIPVACIVFVLIGAPLAVRFPRGGAGMVIAASLIIFGIYYVSLIGGETLGDSGAIPPFLGPWGPNFIFFAVGLLALTRLGRETSSNRGGGVAEAWITLRSLLSFQSPRRRRGPGGDADGQPGSGAAAEVQS